MNSEAKTCQYQPDCPGCPHFGSSGIEATQAQRLARLGEVLKAEVFDLQESNPWGYRHRVRLAVRGRVHKPKIGIFKTGTHHVVPIPECPIHHPLINKAMQALGDFMRGLEIRPYYEEKGSGLLRYVQAVVERPTQKVQLSLVINRAEGVPQVVHRLAELFVKDIGDDLHSIWVNHNASRHNNIFSDQWTKLGGEDWLQEKSFNNSVFFHPASFGQAHLNLADVMVEQLAAWVGEGNQVTEYHAGVGALGIGLVDKAKTWTFNEISKWGVAGLRHSIKSLRSDSKDRCRVVEGRASQHLTLMDHADVVICDPPRKGLGAELLAGIVARKPQRFIVLHCSMEALEKDAKALAAGGMRALEIRPFAMFPFTKHLEVMSLWSAP